jgi:hypothetical protein
MYDSEDDYDSDEEPEFLSEEDMEFLSDHQQDAALGQKTKQSVWGVIDKAKLVHVQVSKLHASRAIPWQLNCHAMYFCTRAGSISCCCTRDPRLLPRYSQKAADLLPMGQGGLVWYAASHSLPQHSSLVRPNHLGYSCYLGAGTLADRSEEAVYQAAGVTSKSEEAAADGMYFCQYGSSSCKH